MNGRALRVVGLVLALSLAGDVPASASGYGTYPAYQGEKFPASAAGFATLPTSAFDDGRPVVLSYFLDTTGDRRADLADAATFDSAAFGAATLLGAYVSPSDPSVVYALAVSAQGGPYRVQTLKRTASDGWELLASTPLPIDVMALGGTIDTPASRTFDAAGHVHLMAFRRVNGGDWVLAVGTSARRGGTSFKSRFAILHDTTDSDPYADTWSPTVEIPNTEATTIDDRGHALARRILSVSQPFNNSGFLRIVDTNGDGFPDTADEQSLVPVMGPAFGAYGLGDVELGTDRFLAGPYAVFDLDSRHRPINGTERDILDSCSLGCGISYLPFQLWAGHDGAPIAFAHFSPDEPVETPEVLVLLDDTNFNRFSGFHHSSNPFEGHEIVRDNELPDPMMRAGSRADLTELTFSGSWSANAFRSFGVYPGGEAFTFRMGSSDFTSFSVSKSGLVSFVGQVSSAASLNSLQALHGVIAPAWSDGWDTSAVHVFAGYAPANTSFVDGGRVLAFTVEWRGLRLPSWDPDRFISVRLVMFSDGSFRTDFGAFEASELGSHTFVVGYAGPGNYQETGSIDLTDHSWGFAPAGLGTERVIAEEFGAANQSDLGHVWVRWQGYPERLDTANPPLILNPKLVDGRKVTMAAAGSNIQQGAHLVVDGIETFTLSKNAAGSKWVVKPKARSVPGGLRVRDIWSDGLTHQIVVVNPDGEQSSPVDLR